MHDAVRILIVKDVPKIASPDGEEFRAALPDAELLSVTPGADYPAALASFAPDIIIADFPAPMPAGLAVLQQARKLRPGIPFLFITGPADEETVAACMRAGAWDHLRREHLARLGTAVRKALQVKERCAPLREEQENLQTRHKELQALFRQVEIAKREWEITMDCVDDVIILADADNGIRRCNKALAKLAGEEYQDLLHRDWNELRDRLRFRRAEAGSDGQELLHEPSGRSFLTHVYPLEMSGHGLGGSVITLHDISQRKQMTAALEKKNSELAKAYDELKASQAKLLQQEKMASVGLLAAGVAHEINNPIGFVTSNLGTLQKYLERVAEFLRLQSDSIREHGTPEQETSLAEARKKLKIDHLLADIPALIKESLDGVGRVKTIVQNLKNFSRVDQAQRSRTDINQCMEETLNIVWNELKYKATVHREYGELPSVWCYPQQLNQVFMNLLLNAVQAIECKGDITIRTWADDENIHVTVEDTGRGIPAENLPRLFEPFFTTKEVGKGTGLGLSIVYDIVSKQHGGDITVASEVNQGSVFRVRLPLAEKEQSREERKPG